MAKKSKQLKAAEKFLAEALASITCDQAAEGLILAQGNIPLTRLFMAIRDLKQCPQEEETKTELFPEGTDYRARFESPLQPVLFKGWKWWE